MCLSIHCTLDCCCKFGSRTCTTVHQAAMAHTSGHWGIPLAVMQFAMCSWRLQSLCQSTWECAYTFSLLRPMTETMAEGFWSAAACMLSPLNFTSCSPSSKLQHTLYSVALQNLCCALGTRQRQPVNGCLADKGSLGCRMAAQSLRREGRHKVQHSSRIWSTSWPQQR